MDILYTIIIPHKNTPKFLERCLNSIPNDRGIQVIVVDDASDCHVDLKVIQEKYQNVEFYLQAESNGGGHARNIGLKHAKGKWVIFSDADDFFEDNLNEILDKYKDSQADIVYFDVNIYREEKPEEKLVGNQQRARAKYLETSDDKYLRFCYTEPWGKMIKRDIILNNNIQFQETSVANDFLFSIKTGCFANNIIFSKDTIYNYIMYNHSVSKVSKGKILERMKVNLSVQDFFHSNHINNEINLGCTCIVLRYYDLYKDYYRIIKQSHQSFADILLSLIRYKFNVHFMGDVYISGFKVN